MEKENPLVTPESTLEEIIKLKGAADILKKHTVPCITCPMMKMEMNILKIGTICKIYGIDCKKLIDDLNKLF
jgi:hypothetical protein